MKTPKVTVIVAAYNAEKYIGRCLRSLLHQTISQEEYEVIVVNDGSTDKTNYALELFSDPTNSTIKILNNEKNKGLPSALNNGIEAATSKYIVRVDSDDFVNKNFINFLLFYLENNPDADAVACDYFLVNDDEFVVDRVDCQSSPIACGIMFQKDHLVDIGLYDEEFLCHEERELRIRFEKKYKLHHLNIPLYRYRRHNHNMTNDQRLMKVYQDNLNAKHGQ
jgi:glycosyltransferase involved in cell wall biosynthesis